MKTPKFLKIALATILGTTAFGAGMYALNGDFTAKAEETGAINVLDALEKLDFPYISRPYATTEELGIDWMDVRAVFPETIDVKHENGIIYYQDIGADDVWYTGNDFYEEMILTDGYWTLEIGENYTESDFANFGYRHYWDEGYSWGVCYQGKNMIYSCQIAKDGTVLQSDLSNNALQVLYNEGDISYHDYYVDGVLHYHEVTTYDENNNSISVSYNIDGTIQFCTIYSDTYYYYFPDLGWSELRDEWYPEYAIDAPAGFEDVDETWFVSQTPARICVGDHVWEEATCTQPKTCKVCTEREGERLPHNWSNWTEITAATETARGEMQGVCDCGETQIKTTPANSWVQYEAKEVVSYHFYPDHSATTVFGTQYEGTHIGKSIIWAEGGGTITLHASEDGKLTEYVIVVHNLKANVKSGESLIIIDRGVTLNLIVEGKNNFVGRAPIFALGEGLANEEGICNVYVSEGSSLDVAYPAVAEGLVFNVVQGENDGFALTEDGAWKTNGLALNLKNGEEKTHAQIGVLEDGMGVGGHRVGCSACDYTFDFTTHSWANNLIYDEEYCGRGCIVCGYIEEETLAAHNYVNGICANCDIEHDHLKTMENGLCTTCNIEYEALVTIGATKKCFTSLADAGTFLYESDYTSAKITLLKDVNADRSALVVDMDLTLDLAGRALNGFFISVNGEQYTVLTIEDSSETQTGRIHAIAGLTLICIYNGELVVNGGSFDALTVDILAQNEDVVKITINDARAEVASVSATTLGILNAEVVVNGGTFGTLRFREWYCEMQWKGGTIIESVCADTIDNEDLNVSNVLPEGYILVDINGKKVNAEQATVCVDTNIEGNAYSVVYHPTCTYDACKYEDETGHWMECACGEAADKVAHEYGDWKTVTEAKIGEAGEEKRECACGYTDVREIPALEAPKKEGCGGVVGASSVLTVLSAAAVAVIFRKRKEN